MSERKDKRELRFRAMCRDVGRAMGLPPPPEEFLKDGWRIWGQFYGRIHEPMLRFVLAESLMDAMDREAFKALMAKAVRTQLELIELERVYKL